MYKFLNLTQQYSNANTFALSHILTRLFKVILSNFIIQHLLCLAATRSRYCLTSERQSTRRLIMPHNKFRQKNSFRLLFVMLQCLKYPKKMNILWKQIVTIHVYTPTAPIIVVCCHPCVTIIRLRQVVLRMRVECAGAASPWFRLILGNVLLAE